MPKGVNQKLIGGRELSTINQRDALAGSLFNRIISSVNSLAKNAAVAAVGKLSPPNPIDSVQVKGALDTATNTMHVSGEVLHLTVTHNQALQKGIQYIHEISENDPNFTAPHQIDHGCSRSGFIPLPTFKDDGVTPNVYYLRSIAQYHGSDPTVPTVFGGITGATKIIMGGISSSSLLPSQGSGTAKNGQQGGKGLGTVLNRPAPGPQRNLK
jgi:hypothetical protein